MGDNNKTPEDPNAVLLTRLNVLLERLLKQEPDSSPGLSRTFDALKTFLNSAFFVTAVSGILLAWLSFSWQKRAADRRDQESQARQTAERKERLAYQFAGDFPLTLHLAGRFTKRGLWMAQPEAHQPGAHYSDGRTFAETRDYAERLGERYFSLSPAGSICNQIVAAFSESTNITALARLLNANVSSLILATNEADVDSAFDMANAYYQRLTEAIFTELNKTNANTKPPH